MISIPRTWTVVPEAGMLELVHPEGRAIGLVHYRERMRPLARLGVLVREYLALNREFTTTAPYAAERLVTREGEHAALVTLRGTEDGAPAQRDLGFVFGDDFFASLTGQSTIEARFDELTATVRDLVTSDSHGLGVRRRRFEYTPPVDWEPIVEGFVTDWYPPGFPNDPVILTVRPANPRTLEPLEMIAAMMQELGRSSYHVEIESGPTPVAPSADLHGAIVTLRLARAGDRELIKQVAVVRDARFAYSLEVTARSVDQLEAHPRMLEHVVESIRPVPQARSVALDLHLFSHWSE